MGTHFRNVYPGLIKNEGSGIQQRCVLRQYNGIPVNILTRTPHHWHFLLHLKQNTTGFRDPLCLEAQSSKPSNLRLHTLMQVQSSNYRACLMCSSGELQFLHFLCFNWQGELKETACHFLNWHIKGQILLSVIPLKLHCNEWNGIGITEGRIVSCIKCFFHITLF